MASHFSITFLNIVPLLFFVPLPFQKWWKHNLFLKQVWVHWLIKTCSLPWKLPGNIDWLWWISQACRTASSNFDSIRIFDWICLFTVALDDQFLHRHCHKAKAYNELGWPAQMVTLDWGSTQCYMPSWGLFIPKHLWVHRNCVGGCSSSTSVLSAAWTPNAQ